MKFDSSVKKFEKLRNNARDDATKITKRFLPQNFSEKHKYKLLLAYSEYSSELI